MIVRNQNMLKLKSRTAALFASISLAWAVPAVGQTFQVANSTAGSQSAAAPINQGNIYNSITNAQNTANWAVDVGSNATSIANNATNIANNANNTAWNATNVANGTAVTALSAAYSGGGKVVGVYQAVFSGGSAVGSQSVRGVCVAGWRWDTSVMDGVGAMTWTTGCPGGSGNTP